MHRHLALDRFLAPQRGWRVVAVSFGSVLLDGGFGLVVADPGNPGRRGMHRATGIAGTRRAIAS